MSIEPFTVPFLMSELKNLAKKYDVEKVADVVLSNIKFPVWSGSSKPHQHHYGESGLILHTYEVIKLCIQTNHLYADLNSTLCVNDDQLFLAALFHDSGKMWDYEPKCEVYKELISTPRKIDLSSLHESVIKEIDFSEWEGTDHKRKIHHISRSGLVWQKAAEYSPFPEFYNDEILHAILSHHGLREWGSPVAPATRLAWMLHLCDSISARLNDCDKKESKQ